MPDLTALQSPHVAERLREDVIIWLTTVNGDGQPQSSPVWFVWDGETFLIYSRPNRKVDNAARHPRVSLHLNDDGTGGDVVTVEGDAQVDEDAPPANRNPAYLEKYRRGIDRIGMDPDGFAAAFSVPIRIRPTRVRAW
jgi:PPOX class probable F420-dependent enzyme